MGMGWIRDGGIRNWEVTTSPSHIPISHILISHILISHIPPFPMFPGLQRILVPFSRIPPPPLEPNGFRSEAGTFRGTPPELRPYGNCREFREFSWGGLGIPRPHPGFPNFSQFLPIFPTFSQTLREFSRSWMGTPWDPWERP